MARLPKTIIAIAFLIFANTAIADEKPAFYVGVSGGGANSFFGTPGNGPATAGLFFTGQPVADKLDFDRVFGFKVGWQQSDQLRFDLSYNNLYGEMKWAGVFPGFADNLFDSNFQSQVILASAYFSPVKWGKLKPYVGFGIGVALNRLDSIEEFSGGNIFAQVEGDTLSEFAYRFVFGTDYSLLDAWKLDFEYSFLNIGGFSTGGSRTRTTGVVQQIGKYEFNDAWIGSATIGVRYIF